MRPRVLLLIAAVVAALGIAVPTSLAATNDGIVVFAPSSQVSDTYLDLGDGGFSAGGNLTFYGAGVFGEVAEGIDFALTGGAGRYAGTRGTVTVAGAEANGEEGVTISFHLTRR